MPYRVVFAVPYNRQCKEHNILVYAGIVGQFRLGMRPVGFLCQLIELTHECVQRRRGVVLHRMADVVEEY